jgi:hypothetical protein
MLLTEHVQNGSRAKPIIVPAKTHLLQTQCTRAYFVVKIKLYNICTKLRG